MNPNGSPPTPAPSPPPSRRGFLARLGGVGAALTLSSCAKAAATTVAGASPARAGWDVSWIERVKSARHRAVFDAPGGGDVSLMLAARYLDNVEEVYGRRAPDAIAVLNFRTRAVYLALADALWQKYPLGEEYKITDPVTNAQARRNVNLTPAPGVSAAEADMAIERLHQRGAIFLVCDFALGHLSSRLAGKVRATKEAVHAELRAGFVPGAIAVPSGIFGSAEAQEAGCAFVPA